MAITNTGKDLGDAIAALIIAPDADADVKKGIIKLWEDIGDVIVNHFINNAELVVDAGIAVSTSGSAVAQTGATTAPGKGTIK
jgi:hypothetical protein